jgi:hypothetical protein
MNQRYQGDGPGGQTRKSAARAKPVTQAASSVHTRKKPQTDAEKRAARKAREKEEQRKAAEKAQKQAEKDKIEASAKAKAEAETGADAGANVGGVVKRQGALQAFLGRFFAPNPNAPSSEEYRKWRRVYWILIVIGMVFIAAALIVQLNLPDRPVISMVSLACAYAPVIAAFVIDRRKVQPILKERQKLSTGNKSPKQLKHEQEARERAAAVEAARKAAKDAKKSQRRRKPDDTIVPGDEQ